MPILVYCIIDPNSLLDLPPTGITGEPLEAVQHSGLCCLASRLDTNQAARVSGKEVALAFHRVLQRVFAQAAIIPFRFPTTVQNEQELRGFLDDHREEYREFLGRLRDMVQMEVRIEWRVQEIDIAPPSQSGGEYLRQKRQRLARVTAVADAVHSAVNTIGAEWRERGSSSDVRLFALVPRSSVSQFNAQLAGLEIDPELVVRISGPWPATEFLERDHARS